MPREWGLSGANKHDFSRKQKAEPVLYGACLLCFWWYLISLFDGRRRQVWPVSLLSLISHSILTLPKLGLCPKQFSFQTPRVPSYFTSVFWLWQTLRLYWWLNNHYLISRLKLNSSLFMFNLHVLSCVPGSKICVININLCFGSTRFFILCPILVISIGRSPPALHPNNILSPLFNKDENFRHFPIQPTVDTSINFNFWVKENIWLTCSLWSLPDAKNTENREHAVQTLQTDIVQRFGFQI